MEIHQKLISQASEIYNVYLCVFNDMIHPLLTRKIIKVYKKKQNKNFCLVSLIASFNVHIYLNLQLKEKEASYKLYCCSL
jgi:hypothetical protein